MKVQKSIDLAASPEKVWPFLIEPNNILQWYIPLQRFEYTTSQYACEGAPLYFEEKVAGRLMKLNCLVTECVENNKFAFKMTSGNMMKSYEEKWTVETTPSGSTFTFMEQGELPYGFIGRVMEQFAQRMSASTIDRMLVKLKSLVEV